MIKDHKLRENLFASFPVVSDEACREIEYEKMGHYNIFHKRGKEYFVFCTKCRSWYFNDLAPLHKGEYECHNCKSKVTTLSAGLGKKSIKNIENFVVLKAVDGILFARCFQVAQTFSPNFDYKKHLTEDYEQYSTIHGFQNGLLYNYYEKFRYAFTPNGVQKWCKNWIYGNEYKWSEMKSENEPSFPSGGTFRYIIIGLNEVFATHLKYAIGDWEKPNQIMAYFSAFTKHPNIEYLYKTGFGDIINNNLDKDNAKIRINYRTNNVKKMLNLNKTEMALLANQGVYIIDTYREFKQAMQGESVELIYKFAVECGGQLKVIQTVKQKIGLSYQQLWNYYTLQKELLQTKAKGFLNEHIVACDYSDFKWSDYDDYLDQCISLGYNMTNDRILRPKNMLVEHAKLSKIIKYRADKAANAALKKRNEKLVQYNFSDDETGLSAVIPKTHQDIIKEGAELSHCVGGYAERHTKGILTIIFIRKTNDLKTPYYTLELTPTKKGEVLKQCRGKGNCHYNNNPEVKAFVTKYLTYLKTLKNNKKKGGNVA